MTLKRKHKGAYSEHLAVTWLLEQGYDVFRNVSPCGICDVLALNCKTGDVIKIDVKSAIILKSGKVCISRPQTHHENLAVKFLAVLYKDGSFSNIEWEENLEKSKKQESLKKEPVDFEAVIMSATNRLAHFRGLVDS